MVGMCLRDSVEGKVAFIDEIMSSKDVLIFMSNKFTDILMIQMNLSRKRFMFNEKIAVFIYCSINENEEQLISIY